MVNDLLLYRIYIAVSAVFCVMIGMLAANLIVNFIKQDWKYKRQALVCVWLVLMFAVCFLLL